MEARRSRIVGVILGIVGILGVAGHLRSFFNSPVIGGAGEFILVKLPLPTSILLLASSYGLWVSRKWGIKVAIAALVLWICIGVSAVYFVWTFHPWGELRRTDLALGIGGSLILGVVAPALLLGALRRAGR